jgi:hypothetical protein
MPTPAELDQLSAIIQRLTPLTTIARGDLIRSQDWNVMVTALIDVARTVIAEGQGAPVPPHEHGGQITLDWLTPGLRATVEGGPLADPFESARLAQAEGRVTSLGAKLEGLDTALNQVRVRLSELAGRDATRESQIQSFNVKLASTDAIRDDNLALRTSLAGIQSNVSAALSVGQKLIVDGAPVDMQAVTDRVKVLESFRDGLKTPEGTLLDAATIEAEITARTASLVSKADLEAAFTVHPVTIPAAQLAALSDSLSASIKSDVTTTMNQIAAGIKAQTDASLAGIDGKVARAVGDALPSLGDTILARLQPQIAAAVQGGVAQMQSLLDRQLGDATTGLRADMARSMADLQSQLGTTVRDQLERQLQVSLEPVQKSLTTLSTAVQANTTAIARHDDILSKLGQRVEVVAQSDTAARDQLKTTFTEQITEQVTEQIRGQTTQLQARLDSRLAAADAATKQAIAETAKTVNARIDQIALTRGPGRAPQ